MQIVATQIRTGMILIIDDELYRVTWVMHRTPGKGNACMQTKLKNIISGKNLEKRFLSSERVERAELNTTEMQFLYSEPTGPVFMDNATFEQVTLSNDLIGDGVKFLTEGQSYPVTFHDGNAVGIELPNTVDLKVTSAPPEIKKATAAASLRPVEVENGMTVNAPSFIKDGDVIRVNTSSGEYIERV